MLKGIIFDMDGLMLDTEKLFSVFWKKGAEYYGFNMSDEQALGMRSLNHRLAEEKLKNYFGKDCDYYAVRAKRIELMNRHIARNGVEKKKGLDELLEYLSGTGLKLAVATATCFNDMQTRLKSVGVFHYFDEFVCGDEVKESKPAPDIYIEAAKKLGCEPKDCIALEDSPNGIRSAYDAGCMPIMIPDMSQPDDDVKAMLYAVCGDLTEVIDIINTLCGTA